MKVRELIEKLQMEDPDAVVFYSPGGGQYSSPESMIRGFTTDREKWFFHKPLENRIRPAISIDDVRLQE